jgi:midasin
VTAKNLFFRYKPVSIITIIRPLFEDYETLFDQTFDRTKNVKFFTHLQSCLSTGRFADFLRLLIETASKAAEQPKTDHFSWTKLIVRAKRILHSLSSRKSALPFAYIRGIVSEAAELGHWLLIDEINLASPDCLESVVRVLEGTLSCHKNFRLFACMNPPTDAGKRQLPSNIRSRFTEFFVFETTELEQLAIIVRNYAPTIPAQRLNSLLNFYNETRLLMPRRYRYVLCIVLL